MPVTNYPEHRRNLLNTVGRLFKELPGPMGAFGQLNQKATADGVLSHKTKELIALGISIAVRCEGCISSHLDDALNAGATREEIVETIGVAVLMGGGPAAAAGAEVYKALEQFEAARTEG